MVNDNIPNELREIIDKRCKINIKKEINNDFDYKNLKKEEIIGYELKYGDDLLTEIEDHNQTRPIIMTNNKIKYKYTSKNKYSLDNQIPMMKLFMGVYIGRKYIKYEKINDEYVFLFNLFNNKTERYDYEYKLKVNDKILVNNKSEPIIIDGGNKLDYLLLKSFIKLCNMMSVKIDNVDINALVGICKGGQIYRIEIDKSIDINNMYFSVSELLDGNINDNREKQEQCYWLSENIMNSIIGEEVIPYNPYSRMIYLLNRNKNLIGITLRDSLMYVIKGIDQEEYGNISIRYLNMFNGDDIKIGMDSLIYGLKHISIVM